MVTAFRTKTQKIQVKLKTAKVFHKKKQMIVSQFHTAKKANDKILHCKKC